MRIYETTFIVNPQMEEATIDRQVKAVADIITQNGGNILQENHLGTRRLAYEIKGLTQGFYGGFIFESANETLTPLDRLYKLNEAYLRHLTVRFEGNEAELRPEKASEEPAAKSAEPTATAAPEPTAKSAEPEAKVEEAAAEPAVQAEVPESEVKAETPAETPVEPAVEPKPDENASEDTEEML
jgi:small subunit ribosomal protein S6